MPIFSFCQEILINILAASVFLFKNIELLLNDNDFTDIIRVSRKNICTYISMRRQACCSVVPAGFYLVVFPPANRTRRPSANNCCTFLSIVRYWHLADIVCRRRACPLLGGKRTSARMEFRLAFHPKQTLPDLTN